MDEPTTGVLATECADCKGTGRFKYQAGMERLWYSVDCDECRGSGWTVHPDIPAVSTTRAEKALRALAPKSQLVGVQW